MKKTVPLLLITIVVLSVVYPNVSAADAGIITERRTIEIASSDQGLLVEENIPINNSGDDVATTLRFWIRHGASELQILAVEPGQILTPIVSGNTRECNLTTYNLSLAPGDSFTIRLTYVLPATTETFQKTFYYEATFLDVTFNERALYSGGEVKAGSSLELLLYKPTEAPLSMLYIAIIVLLVIIIVVITLLLLRKQRAKTKPAALESEEILTTKKALLLSVLKDIEKQHRSHSISDDTYTKLKEEFKQQAVTVMKKLEDTKK